MLTVSDHSDFSLKAVRPGAEGLHPETAFAEITSQSDAAKWKVVFFWPKDFTFVCPTEIVAFGKLASEFADRDAVVYGVSVDHEYVHLNLGSQANEPLLTSEQRAGTFIAAALAARNR